MRLLFGITCFAIAVTTGCEAPPSATDDARRLSLGAAARLGGTFTRVIGVRELSDGSVWVADDRELTLTRTAVDRDPLVTIRDVGQGPLEYEDLERLLELRRDTTAVWTGTKLLLVHDSGIVGSAGPAFGELAPLSDVLGVDRRDQLLISERGSTRPASGEWDGTRAYAILQRSDRRLSFRDSVAVIQRGTTAVDQRVMSIARDSEREGIAYFPDGSIAVVRAKPYRIEWVDPDGTVTSSDTLPVPESFPRPAVWLDITEPIPTSDPSVLVPLVPSSVLGDSTRYDVVSREGRSGFFVLPPNHNVIGSGRSTIYVVSTSDLGLQSISRVPWPPSR